MARALIIGAKEVNEIRAAYNKAQDNPISWDVLSLTMAPRQNVDVLTLDNRQKGLENARPMSQQVLIPYGYRMAVSFEHQPAGLLAHFSFSVESDKPGALPNPVSIEMILDVLGFDLYKADSMWQEEFLVDGKPGGLAVNLLFMIEPNNPITTPVAGRA
jgi:hypothetical protein